MKLTELFQLYGEGCLEGWYDLCRCDYFIILLVNRWRFGSFFGSYSESNVCRIPLNLVVPFIIS